MALAIAAGFVVAITLALTLPLYADAVYHRIMERELRIDQENDQSLPPFAFLFRFNVFWQEPAPWSDVARADQFMDTRVPRLLQLERTDFLRYFQTTNLRIFPATTKRIEELADPLLLAPITSISKFGDHVNLLEGKLPEDRGGGTPDNPEPVEVLISKQAADVAGFQVGDRYTAMSGTGFKNAIGLPVVITGVWEPRDRYEPYWFYRPDLLDGMLITSEDAFTRVVGPRMKNNLAEALWYINFNGDTVRVWNADQLVERIRNLDGAFKADKVSASVSASPETDLVRYQRDSRALTAQLFAFSIPLFVLVLTFVILVASLSAASQRNEIAVLRSRGATAWQVLGIGFLGACVLGGLALAVSAPIAWGVVQLIGQTRSFLSFVLGQPLPVAFTGNNFPFGVAMMAVSIFITVLPIAGAARFTIITYKQEQARTLRAPWWQRMGLDLLLLIPAVYWTYLLQRQGSVDIAGLLKNPGSDPFSNPSLFLLPGLAMFAVTLFVIRLLPLALRVLAWLFGRLPGTSFVLAARELARSPGLYATPTLLLVLTVSQAVYTASVAATLDRALIQQVNYTIGADVRMYDIGQDTKVFGAPGSLFGAQAGSGNKVGSLPDDSESSTGSGTTAETLKQGPRWLFMPLSEYAKVEGVEAAARVGYYSSVMNYSAGDGAVRGHVLGVDRLDYPRVAYWRTDFANAPLVELMNALASAPDAVLVPEAVMKEHALNIGDRVQVSVGLPETDLKLDLVIAGAFKLWPGWYPNKKDSGALYIANLDYIFEMGGGQAPYDVWVRAKPGADAERVVQGIRNVDKSASNWRIVDQLIEEEQTRPQRQGLFGVLSIGFGAAALLTLGGFILYAVFSWRRRLIEMGVLRAIGFSTRQMAVYLGCELGLLLIIGLLAGTAIGVAASRLYIPYLQVIATDEMRSLPFIVVVNWGSVYGIYTLFGLLFVAGLVSLLAFLKRMRIFQAVKMGETV